MSRDVVRHSLADARAVSDLFERVSPSVIWQKLWVRDTEVANPISKTLSGLSVARLLCFQRIVATICARNSVEHRASPVLLHELQKALFDQVVVNGHDAGPFVLHGPSLRRDPQAVNAVPFDNVGTPRSCVISPGRAPL